MALHNKGEIGHESIFAPYGRAMTPKMALPVFLFYEYPRFCVF